jgi:hypothetical protein
MFCALGQDEGMIFNWYQRILLRHKKCSAKFIIPEWLQKPLGGCYKCFVGQVCLWYFIFTKPFDIIELLFFISVGILSAMVYNKIYCFLK